MTRIIAPSLLAANFGKLEEEIASVQAAGADWLHIDVMDGSFVPPITFGTNIVSLCKGCSPLFRDVHLMIENPGKHLESFIRAGAQGITFHVEASKDPQAELAMLRAANIQAGLSLRPETPFSALLPLLPFCDLVLVMTVSPGYGGQAFMPEMLDKILALSRLKDEHKYSYIIEVDGGINPQTATDCAQNGASAFVAGSSIFSDLDRKRAIDALRLRNSGEAPL